VPIVLILEDNGPSAGGKLSESLLEYLAPMCVILELIEAGASWGKEHHIASLGAAERSLQSVRGIGSRFIGDPPAGKERRKTL